jgi:plastocyanin
MAGGPIPAALRLSLRTPRHPAASHSLRPTEGASHAEDDRGGSAVTIRQYCFSPTILHTRPGTEVTFTNQDPTRHGVLGANAVWGSFETLREDRSDTYSFSEPGVYPYVCVWHPGMVGAVVVGRGGTTLAATGSGGDAMAGGGQVGRASPWKAAAVAASGLLALVVIGAAGMRRRTTA